MNLPRALEGISRNVRGFTLARNRLAPKAVQVNGGSAKWNLTGNLRQDNLFPIPFEQDGMLLPERNLEEAPRAGAVAFAPFDVQVLLPMRSEVKSIEATINEIRLEFSKSVEVQFFQVSEMRSLDRDGR